MKAVLVTVMGAPSACAKSRCLLSKLPQADYQSRLTHGAMDVKDKCTDKCHWYVLQPGQGFAHQSSEFALGYVRGFCSVSPDTSSDADQASWDCNVGPTSASWVVSPAGLNRRVTSEDSIKRSYGHYPNDRRTSSICTNGRAIILTSNI